jgi:hypothetical protein
VNGFPPIRVPFADYAIAGTTDVLLYQKVGRVVTDKPLLLMSGQQDDRRAVLLGEHLWRWRLQEYADHQSHEAFDQLVSKVIQFLSTKDDRRRFRAYPLKNEYTDSEVVVFEAEVYNEIYEPTYGHKIDITIGNEEGERSFSFVTSPQGTRFRIGALEQGIYRYTASTTLEGKQEVVSGTFTVQDLQIENIRLTADHNLLRNLAQDNSGNFYTMENIDELVAEVQGQEPIDRIYSTEDYLAIINMKWGFFLLLLLVSAEWFLRKYYGSY